MLRATPYPHGTPPQPLLGSPYWLNLADLSQMGGQGPSLQPSWSGGSGASLHVSLHLSHGHHITEQPFQKEQPPLLMMSNTPIRVVFALLTQKELPS